MEYKFSNIKDPENCPIEELEKEVERLDQLGNFYETKQLALKKFINSVYGATASKYFIAHNTAVAESITLQGQDLNHFSENSVNEYFSGIFQNDTELHKKLGIKTEDAQKVTIGKGKVTDTGLLTGSEFEFLNGNQSLTVAGDTDSVSGDTEIYLDNKKEKIENAYNKLKQENNNIVLLTENKSEIIPVNNHTTLSYINYNSECSEKPISYIMRHKVSKPKYTITTESGKKLTITEDHSIMILRNNELTSVKVTDINKETDKIITIL
jgi:hypothetical protein